MNKSLQEGASAGSRQSEVMDNESLFNMLAGLADDDANG
jgi:hypothetical protein